MKDHYDPEAWRSWENALSAARKLPDRAVVWNFEGFKRELLRSDALVKMDPDTSRHNAFMGLSIVVDESLAPGMIELRHGEEVIRTIKLDVEEGAECATL